MDSPTRDQVRAALAPFDVRAQKIVAGMLGVMIAEPTRVRDREWMSEHLVQLTVLAGGFEADSGPEGVEAVQAYLTQHGSGLLSGAMLLFQRVALDMAPRAEEGFGFDDAMQCGLSYFSAEGTPHAGPVTRDLGEQPLARLMAERELSPKDLVAASDEQITHKMVSRAAKGRRVTKNTMDKVHRAWNRAAQAEHQRAELFDYEP